LFVGLKYIFETKGLDEIILKEFSLVESHNKKHAAVYKLVAGLQSIGRFPHRQMLIRLGACDATEVHDVLEGLSGVVFEDTRDVAQGVYIWKVRHERIARIIAESKFTKNERFQLIEAAIEALRTSVDCEKQFASHLCNSDLGIQSLPKPTQLETYRKLVEKMPFERVPRHRVVRELIAEARRDVSLSTNVDIAISSARADGIDDGVISRYEVEILILKGQSMPYYDSSDRVNVLENACAKARSAIRRRPDDKYAYKTFCDAAFALRSLDETSLEASDSLTMLNDAYNRIGDEQILGWIGEFTSEEVRFRRKSGAS
jgi:hypothetical protein